MKPFLLPVILAATMSGAVAADTNKVASPKGSTNAYRANTNAAKATPGVPNTNATKPRPNPNAGKSQEGIIKGKARDAAKKGQDRGE